MSSRSTAFLNTGLSSAVERKRLAAQEELHNKRIAEKEAVKVSLTRDGSVIQEWIDQEIKDVADFTKMVLNLDNEENVRAQLLAIQMHINWLRGAKTKVKKYMKAPQEKTNE